MNAEQPTADQWQVLYDLFVNPFDSFLPDEAGNRERRAAAIAELESRGYVVVEEQTYDETNSDWARTYRYNDAPHGWVGRVRLIGAKREEVA